MAMRAYRVLVVVVLIGILATQLLVFQRLGDVSLAVRGSTAEMQQVDSDLTKADSDLSTELQTVCLGVQVLNLLPPSNNAPHC